MVSPRLTRLGSIKVSFTGLAWKTYHLPQDWTVGGTLLRHVLGLVSYLSSTIVDAYNKALISLHIWAAVSSYEVLGDFGEHHEHFP